MKAIHNSERQVYIDKSECLEKGIALFPSIYIEGNASCGKSVAVQTLLEKHPDVEKRIFWMDRELQSPGEFLQKLIRLEAAMEEKTVWAVFENLPGSISEKMSQTITEKQFENISEGTSVKNPENRFDNMQEDIYGRLVNFVKIIRGESRAIFVSREKCPKAFLKLLWKQKMEWISMTELLFTREEVRYFLENSQSSLNPDRVYEKTGGWPGCVNGLVRLAEKKTPCETKCLEIDELLGSYEMKAYIQGEILEALHPEELRLLTYIAYCRWVNVKLCQEAWGIHDAGEKLENLFRKGMLTYDPNKYRWKMAPLFLSFLPEQYAEETEQYSDVNADCKYVNEDCQSKQNPSIPGAYWFEQNGYIGEAMWCLKQFGSREVRRNMMLTHYDRIPFLGIDYEEVMDWQENTPQICYLRGMYCYSVRDFQGLNKEIQLLSRQKDKTKQVQEILLNLYYVNPQFSLTEWLQLLESMAAEYGPVRLYDLLGNSMTYLCGLRDLSGMFSCTKKEESYRGILWRRCLGAAEWKCYQLTRVDYYLETERIDALKQEDRMLLFGTEDSREEEPWQLRVVRLYLLCKYYRQYQEDEVLEIIHMLEASLMQETNPVCISLTEAISSLYSSWHGERKKLSGWLRYAIVDSVITISEENYMMLFCRAKGYLLLNQYERAHKILKKLLPYMQSYSRHLFVAEILFQSAIVNWGAGMKGQAVRNAIESFLISGNNRYVRFYAGYGQKGLQVLEAYIEWLRSSMPERWYRKKKYNYGNVLRMPVEDYVEVVLRCTKKESRTNQKYPDELIEERLTMMETIILQNIGSGMTNAQICEELNLKLPTVKGHIYSLFKKLGVNSRVQAILKGKELGVLE